MLGASCLVLCWVLGAGCWVPCRVLRAVPGAACPVLCGVLTAAVLWAARCVSGLEIGQQPDTCSHRSIC